MLCGVLLTSLLLGTAFCQQQKQCDARKSKQYGSVVCVCNGTYCDDFPRPRITAPYDYIVYTSNEAGLRFHGTPGTSSEGSSGSSSAADPADPVLNIDPSKTFQEIIGFGGAFTDAAAIMISKLPSSIQMQIIQSYFSVTGLEYSIMRVPIGGTDFSVRPYTLDDNPGDFDLGKFSLSPEDIKYRIPLMNVALKESADGFKLFASPWSAPGWLKTNNNLTGKGTLIGDVGNKYHKTWANYFVKFLDAYRSHGFDFWGVTAQNEPSDGLQENFFFNCMGFTPEHERDFIKTDLGPTLKAAYPDVKLMMLDDNRLWVPKWTDTVLSDTDAAKFIDGIALHWYLDVLPASVLDTAAKNFPTKFLLGTEACNGDLPWNTKVNLGDWSRGEKYAKSIIEDLEHHVGGWVDWNIALDYTGGPNWANNRVDSPIIIDRSLKKVYKQPMFYVLGHFSKFMRPKAKRIQILSDKETTLQFTAVINSDKRIVVVVHNIATKPYKFTIQLSGKHIAGTIPARAIQTYIWQ